MGDIFDDKMEGAIASKAQAMQEVLGPNAIIKRQEGFSGPAYRPYHDVLRGTGEFSGKATEIIEDHGTHKIPGMTGMVTSRIPGEPQSSKTVLVLNDGSAIDSKALTLRSSGTPDEATKSYLEKTGRTFKSEP